MTTLDVRVDQLRTAVAPYPVVKDLRVQTHFPHGMRIQVIEQQPVGAVVVDGRPMAVAADGTLLHDVPTSGLPTIPLKVPPGGSHVSDGTGRDAVAVLAAAPYGLLSRISEVTVVSRHGLVAQVRDGPSLYFGDPTQLGAKWKAATAVLSDPGSAGAVYIDLTDPERPAAGAGSSAAAGGSTSATAASSSGASGSSPGG
jgi:cell division protein FtsQ